MLSALTLNMKFWDVENSKFEAEARRRMKRHPVDWPIVAAALELDCPIWTDDRDFFGCGVATWATANVEIYLARQG